MHLIQRDWDRISMKSVERVLISLEERLEEVRNKPWSRFKAKLPWTSLYRMRDEADFKIVQLIFKTQFHLKHNFDYVMYAKAVLEDLVVDLANISVYHWIGICLFCVCTNVGQRLAADADAAQWTMSELIITDEEEAAYERQEEATGGNGRRQLGGGAPADPFYGCSGLACGLEELDFWAEVGRLRNTSFLNYTNLCSVCVEEAKTGRPDASDAQLAFAMGVYFCIGLTLLISHTLINASLGFRMNKLLKLSGAHDAFKVKDLLVKLQADLNSFQQEQLDRAKETRLDGQSSGKAIEIFEEDENGNDLESDGNSDAMTLVFAPLQAERDGGAGSVGGQRKGSEDVMTLSAFGRIMWVTKFICLMNCFYIGFYVVHMSYKVSKVEWAFLPGDFPTLSNFCIHMALISPTVPMIGFMLPVTIRRMALLWGVLYLSDEAVNHVYLHMEMITSVRRRIMTRLLGSKFLKGTPNPDAGTKLLRIIQHGELVVLSQLVEKNAHDRLSRSEIWDMMNAQHTHTTDKQLKDFMSRSAFELYLKESAADQATAQTARTMVLDPNGKQGDTITVEECTLFILRAVADVLNVASEHGTADDEVASVRDQITDLRHISPENYQAALTIARVKSLFHSVDLDRSGSVTRKELWKAMRKYKIAVTFEELEIILRVMDPDQSGSVSMEEWLDFMLSTEENLEAITLTTEHTINSINASKSMVSGGLGAAKALVGGTVGAMASGLDHTVGALPGVSHVTSSVVRSPANVHYLAVVPHVVLCASHKSCSNCCLAPMVAG